MLAAPKPIRFRIDVGDIIIKGDISFGDGVNIAAQSGREGDVADTVPKLRIDRLAGNCPIYDG